MVMYLIRAVLLFVSSKPLFCLDFAMQVEGPPLSSLCSVMAGSINLIGSQIWYCSISENKGDSIFFPSLSFRFKRAQILESEGSFY